MLSTLFLVGLLHIGTIESRNIADVDNVIRALDGQVHKLSEGNSIYCRTWVIDIIYELVEKGYLHTNATDEQVWARLLE